MGEAKHRGTYEERKAEALSRVGSTKHVTSGYARSDYKRAITVKGGRLLHFLQLSAISEAMECMKI